MRSLGITIGDRFGRYTVIAELPRRIVRNWLCRCDCGTERSVGHSNLTSGHSKSCGCLQRELMAARMIKHGESCSTLKHSAEYRIWQHMIGRCHRTTHHAYKNYGGRGITVCAKWRESYKEFLSDVGRRPSLQHTIDRHPNNSGHYEPGNVRWANRHEQGGNKRNNRILEYNGERRILADWARLTGIRQTVISKRLDHLGWSVERALTEYPLAIVARKTSAGSGTTAANF